LEPDHNDSAADQTLLDNYHRYIHGQMLLQKNRQSSHTDKKWLISL